MKIKLEILFIIVLTIYGLNPAIAQQVTAFDENSNRASSVQWKDFAPEQSGSGSSSGQSAVNSPTPKDPVVYTCPDGSGCTKANVLKAGKNEFIVTPINRQNGDRNPNILE